MGWQISGGLQTCIAERSKVPNGLNTNCATLGVQQFEQTDGRSGFPFPLRFAGGRLEFVPQAFGLAISMTNPIVQNQQLHTKKILLAQGSVLVLPVLNSMFRLGLVDTLVSHANIKGFGQTSLSGVRRDTVQYYSLSTQMSAVLRHSSSAFNNVQCLLCK